MRSRIIFEFFFIIIYFTLTVSFFYDEHFPNTIKIIHSFDNLSFMVATISFGIIVSASTYNFALYLYLKSKPYLYYALAQLSSLFFLVILDSLYIYPFNQLFQLESLLLFDISQLSMLFFSALFLQSFFKSYHINNMNIFFNTIFILIVLDSFCIIFLSHLFIFKFIPIFFPILLLLVEIYIGSETRDLPLYMIMLGWFIVIVVVFVEYIGIISLFNIVFPFLHIAIALESLILSIAIAYKIRLLEVEKEHQKGLLIQQSRLASMGEMISSITHQWRQPLNVISFGLMNIKKRSVDDEKNLKTIERLNEQVQYMSRTIEYFREFYNPSKNKTKFSVYTITQNSYEISRAVLHKNNIKFNINLKKDFELFGYKNELEQVILNLINNSKDILIEKNVKKPRISIVIEDKKIIITDNGGGVNVAHIDKIFEPYFTTKKNGDGIGLHISKMIIEKEMKGKIYLEQQDTQTLFIIKF